MNRASVRHHKIALPTLKTNCFYVFWQGNNHLSLNGIVLQAVAGLMVLFLVIFLYIPFYGINICKYFNFRFKKRNLFFLIF